MDRKETIAETKQNEPLIVDLKRQSPEEESEVEEEKKETNEGRWTNEEHLKFIQGAYIASLVRIAKTRKEVAMHAK